MSGHSTPEKDEAVVLDTRRRRTAAEREAIVAESNAADVNMSAVARRHAIAPSLLFRWRREAALRGDGSTAAARGGFLPVRLGASADAGARHPGHGAIEILLGGGLRLVVDGRSDLALLKRVIAALQP